MRKYQWMVFLGIVLAVTATLHAQGEAGLDAPVGKPVADTPPTTTTIDPALVEAPPTEPPRFEGVPETAPMAKPTPPPEKRVTLVLVDGSRLIGELVDSPKLQFQTEFGTLTVPIEKIKGARLKMEEKETAPNNKPLVLFNNGDSMSAEPQFESLTLKTVFGESKIERKHISSIVRSTQAFGWSYDGSRWWLTFASDYNSPVSDYPGAYAPPIAVPTRAVEPADFESGLALPPR